MSDDEDKDAGKNRESWFDGHVLTPQEIEDERAKQIERDARSQHRAADQPDQGQEQGSVYHDGKKKASVLARPRTSYDQRIDQYWQKEFAEEGEAESGVGRSYPSQYSDKEVKENNLKKSVFLEHQDFKPPSFTTKGRSDDSATSRTEQSDLENPLDSSDRDTNDTSKTATSEPNADFPAAANHPPPAATLSSPRVVARAPVALYLGHSPDSLNHKTRSIPSTTQIVAAASGEVVQDEDAQSKPGAYAHIGPDGRVSTTSTLSSFTAPIR